MCYNPYAQIGFQPQPYNPVVNTVQHQQPRPALPGRSIAVSETVPPQQVPMDGTVSYFPVNDGSCIYAKQWTADGYIATKKYVPDMSTDPVPETPMVTLENKIDRIISLLEGVGNEHAADGVADDIPQSANQKQP